jgi:hypothetical protein
MHTITTPTGVVVEFHDSLDTLSAKRYSAFNMRWCEHVGIGSDMVAADGHRARIAMFLGAGEVGSATTEFNNYLMNLTMLRRPDTHTGLQALATLTARIGEAACADTTSEGYERTAAQLLETGITEAQVQEALDHVKGKFMRR